MQSKLTSFVFNIISAIGFAPEPHYPPLPRDIRSSICYDNVESMQNFLNKDPKNVEATQVVEGDHMTLLSTVVSRWAGYNDKKSDFRIFYLCLQKKARINRPFEFTWQVYEKNQDKIQRPLGIAIKAKNLQLIDRLLDAGADYKLACGNGKDALNFAQYLQEKYEPFYSHNRICDRDHDQNVRQVVAHLHWRIEEIEANKKIIKQYGKLKSKKYLVDCLPAAVNLLTLSYLPVPKPADQ